MLLGKVPFRGFRGLNKTKKPFASTNGFPETVIIEILLLLYQLNSFTVLTLSHLNNIYSHFQIGAKTNWNITALFFKHLHLSSQGIINHDLYFFICCIFKNERELML